MSKVSVESKSLDQVVALFTYVLTQVRNSLISKDVEKLDRVAARISAGILSHYPSLYQAVIVDTRVFIHRSHPGNGSCQVQLQLWFSQLNGSRRTSVLRQMYLPVNSETIDKVLLTDHPGKTKLSLLTELAQTPDVVRIYSAITNLTAFCDVFKGIQLDSNERSKT